MRCGHTSEVVIEPIWDRANITRSHGMSQDDSTESLGKQNPEGALLAWLVPRATVWRPRCMLPVKVYSELLGASHSISHSSFARSV